MSKNFNFLISVYETECDNLDQREYSERVNLILSLLHLFPNFEETLIRIALHLDSSSFTGSHSYKFNSLFRKDSFTKEDVMKIILYDAKDFYPEYYFNEYLTNEMKMKLKKQIEFDYERVKEKYKSGEEFEKNCEDEVISLTNEEGFQEIRKLNNLLYDMLKTKKDRKTGKEFSSDFHEKIQKLYPYEYFMMLKSLEI